MARRAPWFFGVFVIAIVLHIAWAILLLEGEDALGATPLHALAILPNRAAIIAALLVPSVLAAWSVFRPIRSAWGIAALVPQQIVLIVSAGTSATSIIESSYADGVIRPTSFIAGDQMLVIIVALAHTLALFWLMAFEVPRHG